MNMLRQESVFLLGETLNADDTELKNLGSFRSDDIALYTTTTEQLPILIRVAGNFLKNPNKPAFYSHQYSTLARRCFWRQLRAALFDHHTDFASKCIELSNMPVHQRIQQDFSFCSFFQLHASTQL